jgi:hypothetical protein
VALLPDQSRRRRAMQRTALHSWGVNMVLLIKRCLVISG